MGSSKKQTTGYKYGMGLHFGICHGPVDRILRVSAGDREAWSGSVTDNAQISIDQPEMFGGDKKEGGISGALDVLFGGAAQTANDYLQARLGGIVPGFRGILSAVWRGGQISANNPYIKPWSFRVERITAGWSTGAAWYAAKAPIPVATNSVTGITAGMLSIFEVVFLPATLQSLDPTDTGNPSWIANFSQTIDVGHFRFFGGQTVDMAAGVESKVVPFDPGWTLELRYEAEDVPGNTIEALYEFLDAGGSTLFVIKITTPSLGVVRMQYGPSLLSLTMPGITAGSYVMIYGEITFTASSITFTRLPLAFGNTNTWSAFLDTNSVASIRSTLGPIDFNRGSSPVGYEGGGWLLVKSNSGPGDTLGMNPAHIIYESLTNTSWGMGYPVGTIDDASFTLAADTLFAEKFGLCLMWNKQDTLENFIKVVCDHIGAILYVKPDTGRFALKLIRDDYNPEDVEQFGPSNLVSLNDYQRKAWGETINEITVVYHDVKTDKDAAVTLQDLANIQTQGAVVSQARQYPGLPNAELAQRVGLRDLNSVSAPLAKATIMATRKAWRKVPGDVIRLTWPDLGIEDVVFRVLEIDSGTLQNGLLSIQVAEDVFGLPTNTYVKEQPGEWTEPSTIPAPAPFRKVIEAPYWDLARNLTAPELDYLDDLSGYVQGLAVRPTSDAINFELDSRTGVAEYVERATGDFVPAALLGADIGKSTTAITFTDGLNVDTVEVGGYGMIGDEVVGFTAIDAGAGTATILRGLLDTVPVDHLAGDMVWFSDGFQATDPTEYASGETVDVKLLPRTGNGELALADAPTDSITLAQRHNRPYAPGLFRISGLAYPVEVVELPLGASWAHRDRLAQTAYLVLQSEASIGPEAGTTYSVRLYDDDSDALLASQTGISGTSWTGPDLFGVYTLRLELEAVRGGLVSWQAQTHVFNYINGVRLTEDGDNRETEAGEIRSQE